MTTRSLTPVTTASTPAAAALPTAGGTQQVAVTTTAASTQPVAPISKPTAAQFSSKVRPQVLDSMVRLSVDSRKIGQNKIKIKKKRHSVFIFV